MAQGCSLLPIEQAEFGVHLSSGKMTGGMLLNDDFVGVSESTESLQKLIDAVHQDKKIKANVSKSAVMAFSENSAEDGWKWGEHKLPKVSNCTYLGIDFACTGAWDVHLNRVLDKKGKSVA